MSKSFQQMTADELRNYQGRVYWARVDYFANGKRLQADFEEPTYEALESRIVPLRSYVVTSRGVSFRFSDGKTMAVPDELANATDAEVGAAIAAKSFADTLATECEKATAPPLGTPISELSGRPGHRGYEKFREIARSWGYD